MAAVAVSLCVMRVNLPEGRIVVRQRRGVSPTKEKRTETSRLDNYREIEIHVEIEIGIEIDITRMLQRN